jgi:flagellar basal body-associated protein FliL
MAKNNGRLWRIIGIIVVIIIAVMGVVYGYGGRNKAVEENTKDNARQDVEIQKLQEATVE